jgi:thiamine biosynthesis lipoprotein
LSACTAEEPQFQKIDGIALGSAFHVTYWSAGPVDTHGVEAEVEKILEDIDKNFSAERTDSVIEMFNSSTSTSPKEVGAEVVNVIKTSAEVYQLSQGCFDLTIRPIFELWGFNSDTFRIPDKPSIQSALERVGMSKLKVTDDTHLQKSLPDIKVDISAVVLGYSVGKISAALDQSAIQDYMVEIGGEFKTKGHKPDGRAWVIAIDKPLPDERRMHKIISMPKEVAMSVMTASTYRHYFDANGQRYSHILDARTGKPVTHNLVAVTVLHEDPVLADAWSTALLCLGYQEGLRLANSEKMNVIFFRQQDTELMETQSDSLRTTNNLTIYDSY